MNLISVNEKLPANNQYVLIHLTIKNWFDSEDYIGNRYWRVAKFKLGISEKERILLKDNDKRKPIYYSEDEYGNNKRPFCWDEFGPSNHFGQDVDYWCELPLLNKP